MTDLAHSEELRLSGRSFGLALTLLFIGLGAGALASLLLAPSDGKKTRRKIKRKYHDAIDSLAAFKETAGDILDRAVEWVDIGKEKVTPIRRAIRE